MRLSPSHLRVRQLLPLMIVLASAFVAVSAYLQALNYPFFSDDISYLPENAKLIGLPVAELWRLFAEPYNCCFEYLPLRDFSYWIDINLFGLTPSASRVHNILLYLLCLPLVYAATSAIWKYFRPADAASARWVAAAVTALFALHPALVESVVWISGRKYVLPNLFAMLALWLAVTARREQGLSLPHAAATMVAFAAMMLSKTSFVGLAPLIAMLWVLFWLDIPVQRRQKPFLLWPLAILLLAGLMTLVFVTKNEGFDGMPFYFGIEAVTRTFAVLGWMARLAFSLGNRHFLYPVFEDPNLLFMVALGVAVLVAAVAGGFLILRKRSLEGFALAAFLLLCIPYIQLIPNHPPSLVSDRYLALAVWPAILLIVALLWRLKFVLRIVLLLVIASLWGFQTVERPRDWRSMEKLYHADLHTYPGYYLPAMYEINNVHLPQGLYSEAYNAANSIADPELREIMIGNIKIDQAVHAALSTGNPLESMSLLWNSGPVYKQRPAQAKWNSSVFFFYRKNTEKLVNEWDILAKRFPEDASLRYNAGLWMLSLHKSKHAVDHLRAASESQHLPESVRGTAFRNLGLALINSGKVAEAEAPLLAALKQTPPDSRAYCLLSIVYKRAGRKEDAVRAEADCRSHIQGSDQAE
jgi:protein O-mannosyl-transferase